MAFSLNLLLRRGKERHIFNSHYERRKVVEYCLNLIASPYFLERRHAVVLEFATKILGDRMVLSSLAKRYPRLAEAPELREWIEYERVAERLPKALAIKILKTDLAPALRKLHTPGRKDLTEQRLAIIQDSFSLSSEEVELLAFFYLNGVSELVNSFLDGKVANFTHLATLKTHGHVLMGLKKGKLLQVFQKKSLFDFEILEKRFNQGYELCSYFMSYLSGLGRSDFGDKFLDRTNSEILEITDFGISAEELGVLSSLLLGKGGRNILIYGAPGTGKSSFARSVAKALSKDLVSVRVIDGDDLKDRFKAVYVATAMAKGERDLILVDEADDILSANDSYFFKGARISKAWLNSFLDNHSQKVIWITNRTGEIDPSTLRRFAFSLEFRPFNAASRAKVLRYELDKARLRGLFTIDDINELSSFNVNADAIAGAVRVLGRGRQTKRPEIMGQVHTILRSQQRLTSGKEAAVNRPTGTPYTIEGLNTSYDVAAISDTVRSFLKRSASDCAIGCISLLLYGAPGTGKTAFARHLASQLELQLLIKRASDIFAMWVGETEKNISRAFSDAHRTGQVLLFDEADTFLFPRSEASHSWEKNFTNEILTQLESFSGVVIFATNDIDGLDRAALRRFRFKIEFRPLTKEGVLTFYKRLLAPFVKEKWGELGIDELGRLQVMEGLTPGDFAVVRDRLVMEGEDSVVHSDLINALAEELGYRSGRVRIGFSV